MLHAPGDRLASLASVVRSVDPDLLACQEVNTVAGMMELSRELNMVPVLGTANGAEDHRDGQPVFEHLVILTKIAPNLVRVHPGDRHAMFRPILEVRLQPPGGPEITVFTVHFRDRVDPRRRFLKFREVGSLLSILAEARGPVITMGDFNAWAPEEGSTSSIGDADVPDDNLAATRGGVIGAILDAGFVDSFRLVHPRDGRQESTLVTQAASRVDYIFVNELLTPCISDSFIVDSKLVELASDHRPVVTELTWNRQ
jgi:endonuclease/exonuclease/phosphatase family metal-dependent hydrolase